MMLMDVAEALTISPKNVGGPTGRSNNQSIGKSVCWFQLLQLTDAGRDLVLQPFPFPAQGLGRSDWEYIVDAVLSVKCERCPGIHEGCRVQKLSDRNVHATVKLVVGSGYVYAFHER
jgi:hypothetical protein